MDSYGDLRWSCLTLPTGRKIYLTQRPDRAKYVSVWNFISEKKPSIRFCFTDDIVTDFDGAVPFLWYPWIPGEHIPTENIFAFFCLMDYYENISLPDKSFWLHCDSSTMRAPTFLGLYLYAKWSDKAEEICKKVTANNDNELEMRLKHSIPTEYAQTSMKLDPGVKELIEAWQKGGEKEAYLHLMNRKTHLKLS